MEAKVTLAAHRGWRGKYPENTMLGFRKAFSYGATGFTSDDPDICGEILDRIGARKLRK